ncbi:unnamed protein product [Paramecium sonneborni]|uniref:Uncharacterized protein n=1 Tax=Paramecium sonneborni TaxID=65129 RepID=A0A8S1KDW8_9CILI|nr:unnamed protein product [Paramecium sonneborni]
MQIKIRNYQYSGSIINYKTPQFMIRKSNQLSNKLQASSPEKKKLEKSPQASISKINYRNAKVKTLSLNQELNNQTFICQKPILYNCDINDDTYIVNQKPTIKNKKKRFIPQKTKNQDTTLFSDRMIIGQQFRRFSVEINDSRRSKNIKYENQKLKLRAQTKDLQVEPKGWTYKSSKSLL